MRHYLKTSRYLGMLGIVLIVLIGSRVAKAADEETLRLLYWQAPTILQPHLASAGKDMDVTRLSYEPLASVNAEGNLIAFLAAEIPSLENGGLAPDGKSVTWKLKSGIKWSDGEPFTADDVLFTYEFITNPATNSTMSPAAYEMVERVEVLDDLTVKVFFKNATPAWAAPFTGTVGQILPRHIFDPYNNENAGEAPANMKPVGTGPYSLIEFNTEDILLIGDDLVNIVKLVYEPNPFYRDKDALAFKYLEVRGGGDSATAARAVLSEGSVDFAWNIQKIPEILTEVSIDDPGKVLPVAMSGAELIFLNMTNPNRETETGERSSLEFPHPFLSDKRVRQAFAHAVNRNAIAALYGEFAIPSTNVVTAPAKYISPHTANLYPFDLQRAAALLDEAGWRDTDEDGVRDKDGVKMKVLYQTSVNPTRQEIQGVVKEALEAIGVQVDLKAIDASLFFTVEPHNTNSYLHFYADLQEFAHGNNTPDPTEFMTYWTCDQIPQQANNWSGQNNPRWCNAEYDALAQQLLIELDPEKRKELVIRMNDLLVEEVVHIPLVSRPDIHVISKTLEGYAPTPWDTTTWDIQNWRRKKE